MAIFCLSKNIRDLPSRKSYVHTPNCKTKTALLTEQPNTEINCKFNSKLNSKIKQIIQLKLSKSSTKTAVPK